MTIFPPFALEKGVATLKRVKNYPFFINIPTKMGEVFQPLSIHQCTQGIFQHAVLKCSVQCNILPFIILSFPGLLWRFCSPIWVDSPESLPCSIIFPFLSCSFPWPAPISLSVILLPRPTSAVPVSGLVSAVLWMLVMRLFAFFLFIFICLAFVCNQNYVCCMVML